MERTTTVHIGYPVRDDAGGPLPGEMNNGAQEAESVGNVIRAERIDVPCRHHERSC